MELLKLIIVDDEKIILQGLTETFGWNSIGFQVVGTALNGEDALKLIQTEEPDVVLTDICMKKMDGIALMEKAGEITQEICFVIMSAYKDFEYARRACDLGAFSYIVKPVDDSLLTTMEKVYEACVDKKKKRDDYEQWQAMVLENKSSFKTYMMERYLEDGITLEEMQDVCRMLAEELNENYYAVLCVDVDVVYRIRDFSEFVAKRFALFTYLEKRIKENFSVWLYKNADGSNSFVVDLGDSDKVYKLKLIVSEARKELGFELISALTRGLQGLEGMKKAFCQVQNLYAIACELETDVEEGNQEIYSEENNENEMESRYPYEAENRILSAVRKNEEGQVKEGFIEFIKALGANENGDKMYLHQLAIHIELHLKETYGLDDDMYQRFQEFYAALYRYSSSKLVHMCYDLCLFAVKMRKERIPSGEEQFYNEYIKQACAFIEQHLDEEGLSIGMVADAVHLNSVYFGRVFKSVQNMSFKQYLLNRKIEEAKRLLATTDASITEIGRAVGIASSSYFTKLFKQITGKLPSEYRNR